MLDENGNELSEKELLKEGLALLSDACALLYEIESEEGMAAAFMTDAALRYTSAIYREKDPRALDE